MTCNRSLSPNRSLIFSVTPELMASALRAIHFRQVVTLIRIAAALSPFKRRDWELNSDVIAPRISLCTAKKQNGELHCLFAIPYAYQ